MMVNSAELNRLGEGMVRTYEMCMRAKYRYISCKKALAELGKVARGASIAKRKSAVRKQQEREKKEFEIWKRSYANAVKLLRKAEAAAKQGGSKR